MQVPESRVQELVKGKQEYKVKDANSELNFRKILRGFIDLFLLMTIPLTHGFNLKLLIGFCYIRLHMGSGVTILSHG